MKSISDNFLLLAFTLLLGFASVQNITASVSKCIAESNSLHHHIEVSANLAQTDKAQANSQADCCSQNSCASTQCASASVAVMSSAEISGITYTASRITPILSVSLLQSYPSSLYRPPRI